MVRVGRGCTKSCIRMATRFMSKRAGSTVVEVAGSHAIYVSKPRDVAALIELAAEDTKVAIL
jgi:hypothetical protein